MNLNKDLVVIGAGPGGYEVAIKASQNGLNVALIEKDALGGTCLNYGCIPTKALCKNAEIIHDLNRATEFGIEPVDVKLNFTTIQTRKNGIVNQLKANILTMLNKVNVDFIVGEAAFIDNHHIEVKTQNETITIEAKNFIIATGSVEKIIPIEGWNLPNVLTSKELLDIAAVPNRLAIIGGGVIGVELASIFQQFGSKVVILEYFDRLIPNFDEDVSSRLKIYLKKQGIEILTDALVEKIVQNDELIVKGTTKKGKEFAYEADVVLMATGRKAFYDRLNLEGISVDFNRTGIQVNENYQTNIPWIYAVGDVTGQAMLAHVATYQSFKALDHLLNKENSTDFQCIPACIFTNPEIASVGLTEAQAIEHFGDVTTNKYMFRANGKALTMSEAEGFVKVISHQGYLIGAHIIGVQASTLIQEATLIIEKRIPIQEAVEIIHSHPTLSEVILEALRGLVE